MFQKRFGFSDKMLLWLAGDPIRPVRATVKAKSKGSNASSPTASAKHRASPGGAEAKTIGEGAHNTDSDSDDEEDGGGSSRKGMPPLPHKAMEAMYRCASAQLSCSGLVGTRSCNR